MKIEILSHKELVQRAFQSPPSNLIFISNPEQPFEAERSKDAVNKFVHKLILLFDDKESASPDRNTPQKQHVRDALRFAEGLDELVVSCRMGTSRSAAIAFAVVAQRSGMVNAFQILNPIRHSPNALIISYVEELLELPYLIKAMESWKKGQRQEFEYHIAEHQATLKRREELRFK